MKRAAIYARFSTDLQNEKSCEDQVALCREFAARNDLNVVHTFQDKARSGASMFGRDGLLAMLAQAQEKPRPFDVVLVEHSDRLARDMEDLAGLHKRLTFAGIDIRTVHSGQLDTAMVGLFGLVGQMQREDGAKKVRRGMAGVIRDGRHAGGRAYGFRAVPGQPGQLEIDEAEAAVVQRIFTDYVDGNSPRSIAHALNHEGISPPRGRAWNASTINGNPQRGIGILHNELYAGRIVWNKLRMVKDPSTGKRVSRVNPKSEWQTTERPDLTLIARDVFDAVQTRKRERSSLTLGQRRRPKHLLSGLLKCGCCGSGLSVNGADKSGRTRVRCSAHTESGTCPDPRTFYLDTIESAVLAGLRAEMRDPRILTEYVRVYHEERQRLAADRITRRAALERKVREMEAGIARIIDMVKAGIGDIHRLGADMKADAAAIEAANIELADIGEIPNVVSLHPQVLDQYEERLGRLQQRLSGAVVAGDRDAIDGFRDLVSAVKVYRDDAGAGHVAVEIVGRLVSLLGPEAFPHNVRGVFSGGSGGRI